MFKIVNGYKKRKKDTYSKLYEEFFSNMNERILSKNYKKYLRGITTISPYISTWIKHHPGEPIYAGEVIHHKDGNHNNNNVSNLEKISQSDHGKLFITSLAIRNGICKDNTSRLKNNNLNKPKNDNIKYKHIGSASVSYNKYINNKLSSISEHIKIWIDGHPGKIIYDGEIIHHKNGNHQDNRIENLEKMTRHKHNKHHNH